MVVLLTWIACDRPVIRIVTPSEGAVVCGEPLVVDVRVEHFALVAMDAGPSAEGDGHIDFTLSGQDVMMGHDPPFEIFGMEAGVWLLAASLVTPDHAPLDPPVEDEVQITIDDGVCD